MSTPTGAIMTKVSFDPAVMAVATDWGIKTFVKALNDVVLYLQPALATPAMSTEARRVPLNRGERRQARRGGR